MKRFFLSGIAFMSLSVAIAQQTDNTASLIQQGNTTEASVEQNIGSRGNTAFLFQQGNNNQSTGIQQTNVSFNNRSYLNQYGNNNNETRITQSNIFYNNKATIAMGRDGLTGMYPAG